MMVLAVLVLHWYCTDAALLLRGYCTGTTLVLCSYSTGPMLVLDWYMYNTRARLGTALEHAGYNASTMPMQ